MLAINTSGEYRRASTDRLLQRYADKVAEHMDGNAPFTLEQVRATLLFIRGKAGHTNRFDIC